MDENGIKGKAKEKKAITLPCFVSGLKTTLNNQKY
jgi:hypothetical protein